MPSAASNRTRTVSKANMGTAPGTERFGGHGDPEPRPGGSTSPSSGQAGASKSGSGRKPATKSGGSKSAKLAEAGAMLAGQPEVAEAAKAADAKRQARKAAKASQKPPERSGGGGSSTTTTTTEEGIGDDLKGLGKGLWGLTSPWAERDTAIKAVKVEFLLGLAVIALYPLVRTGGLSGGYLVAWSKKLIAWSLLFTLYLWAGAVNRGFARIAASIGAVTVLALLLTHRTSKETLVIKDIFERINAILDPSNTSHLTAAKQSNNPAFDQMIANTATSAVKGGAAGGLKAPKVTSPRGRPTKNLGSIPPGSKPGGSGSILPQLPTISPPKVAPSKNPAYDKLHKLFPWL